MDLKVQRDGKVVIAYRATIEEVRIFEEVQQALKRLLYPVLRRWPPH